MTTGSQPTADAPSIDLGTHPFDYRLPNGVPLGEATREDLLVAAEWHSERAQRADAERRDIEAVLRGRERDIPLPVPPDDRSPSFPRRQSAAAFFEEHFGFPPPKPDSLRQSLGRWSVANQAGVKESEVYSLAEAARKLRVHPNTLRAWAKGGRVRHASSDAQRLQWFLKGDIERLGAELGSDGDSA